MTDAEAIVRWLVAVTAVSFALAPAVWWLASGLGPARHGLTRGLSIVVATAILWWPASVLGVPFTRLTLVAVVVVTGAVSWIMWVRSRFVIDWGAILAFEAAWFALFGGYAFFRSYHPDIANTEKPMDIALLSSISRSAEVPAADPWFAGEAINYYYFGYQTISSIVKISGVPTSIAFNLALATIFASVGTIAAAAGYRVATSAGAKKSVGVLSAMFTTFFVLLAGNLEAAWRLVRDPGSIIETGWWYDRVGWQASRVIVDHGVHGNPDPRNTINEFPAFSFILGDLHPHVLTYPLLFGIVALVAGLVIVPATATLPRVASIGGLAGLLYASNSWDAPVGFALLLVALLIVHGVRAGRTWTHAAVAGMAALFISLPFLTHFTAPVGLDENEIPDWLARIPLLGTAIRTIGIVNWRPSSVGELLLVHGHWIAAFVLFVAIASNHEREIQQAFRRRAGVLAVMALLTTAVAIAWAPGAVLLGLPAAAAILVVVWSRVPSVRIIATLFAIGFGLVLVPEFLYIQDVFGDRMNTVFKLYFQAWLLLGVASAATLAFALASRRLTAVGIIAAIVLVAATAAYTPISARDWTNDFADRRGLDGMGYIDRINPDEAAAIQWLVDNAPEDATLVEGPGCSYATVGGVPMNRMSAFSGVPALIGWEGHERQWRRGEDPPIDARIDFRQAIANQWIDGNPAETLDLPVPDYIVLGMQERVGSENCEPLVAHNVEESRSTLEAVGWEPVHESGEVVILARP